MRVTAVKVLTYCEKKSLYNWYRDFFELWDILMYTLISYARKTYYNKIICIPVAFARCAPPSWRSARCAARWSWTSAWRPRDRRPRRPGLTQRTVSQQTRPTRRRTQRPKRLPKGYRRPLLRENTFIQQTNSLVTYTRYIFISVNGIWIAQMHGND